MSDKVVIRASGLGKAFPIYSGGGKRLLSALTLGRAAKARDYWALRELSFAVERGEAVGVIGQNGSGKSTLLKLLAGLSRPSEGELTVEGKIGSLIELGTGFNPEFTGRENVRLNAALLGIPPEVLEEKFPEIESFAAIGEFIDRPVKTYSSGMYVRLGFSVTLALEPDILLVDEALAVGDLLFQQKCFARLRRLRENGVTLVLVTHDLASVRNLCERALLLDQGRIVASGSAGGVVDEYNALIQKRGLEGLDRPIISAAQTAADRPRHGSYEAVITGIDLLDAHGEPAAAVTAGAIADIRVRAAFLETVDDPVVGILLRDRLGNDVFGTNSHLHHLAPGRFLPGDTLEAGFRMALQLGAGEYSVTAAIHTDHATFENCFDWAEGLMSFKVLPVEPAFVGVARLEPALSLVRGAPDPGAGAAAFAKLFGDAPAALEAAEEAHGRYFVQGFFPAESDGEGGFRWSREECLFILNPAGGTLSLRALCLPPPGGVLTATLFVDGGDAGSLSIDREGWQDLAWSLPPRALPGPRRILLRLAPPFIPAERHGGADDRRLGIAVRRISS